MWLQKALSPIWVMRCGVVCLKLLCGEAEIMTKPVPQETSYSASRR
jgi:hypothetical protein